MIRKLTKEDQKMVLEYLYQDVSYNIFLIGDIEAFGMETDFQRVYGEFDAKEKLLSVFLRYKENAVYASDQIRFNPEYQHIFKKDPFEFMSGKAELMQLIEPYLDGYTKKDTYFCKATNLEIPFKSNLDIKKLESIEDLGRLFDLLMTIEEFSYSKMTRKDYVASHRDSLKMGITYFIEEDGQIVASVATTAETSKNAMVVGVATLKGYRHKGYASALIHKLMHTYLIEKKKELCLFYNNPEAGKIYMQLGFKPIGKWTMFQNI
jgi:uncharacterized protein